MSGIVTEVSLVQYVVVCPFPMIGGLMVVRKGEKRLKKKADIYPGKITQTMAAHTE